MNHIKSSPSSTDSGEYSKKIGLVLIVAVLTFGAGLAFLTLYQHMSDSAVALKALATLSLKTVKLLGGPEKKTASGTFGCGNLSVSTPSVGTTGGLKLSWQPPCSESEIRFEDPSGPELVTE
jgi:hypothetical protein